MAVSVLSTANANMVDVPTFMQPAGGDANLNYPGNDMRSALNFAYPQFGILNPGEMIVTAGSGNAVNISGGRAVVPNMTEAYPYGGSYGIRSTGSVSLTLPGSGTYYVYAEVIDKYYAGSGYYWQFWADTTPVSGTAIRSAGRHAIYLATVVATGSSITSVDPFLREIASSTGDWISIPSYNNDFTNYGGTYGGGRYRRTGDGLVILDGLLKAGTLSSSGDIMFTLPSGYRPSQQWLQTTMSRLNGNGNNTCYISITTAGGVYAYNTLNTSWLPAKTDWISICGIVFSAAR